MRTQKSESPKQEMARLMRVIAGNRAPGETDPQLRHRAAVRLCISDGRAKSFWYGECGKITAEEMDLARDLAAVQPLENLADALERAEQYIEDLALNGCLTLAERVLAGLQERLIDRLGDRVVRGAGSAESVAVRSKGRRQARLSSRVPGSSTGSARHTSDLNTDPGVPSSLAG